MSSTNNYYDERSPSSRPEQGRRASAGAGPALMQPRYGAMYAASDDQVAAGSTRSQYRILPALPSDVSQGSIEIGDHTGVKIRTRCLDTYGRCISNSRMSPGKKRVQSKPKRSIVFAVEGLRGPEHLKERFKDIIGAYYQVTQGDGCRVYENYNEGLKGVGWDPRTMQYRSFQSVRRVGVKMVPCLHYKLDYTLIFQVEDDLLFVPIRQQQSPTVECTLCVKYFGETIHIDMCNPENLHYAVSPISIESWRLAVFQNPVLFKFIAHLAVEEAGPRTFAQQGQGAGSGGLQIVQSTAKDVDRPHLATTQAPRSAQAAVAEQAPRSPQAAAGANSQTPETDNEDSPVSGQDAVSLPSGPHIEDGSGPHKKRRGYNDGNLGGA